LLRDEEDHDHTRIRAQVELMDMSAVSPYNLTPPLVSACFMGCEECVDLFLARGARAVEAIAKMRKIDSACYKKVEKSYLERYQQIVHWMRTHDHTQLSHEELSIWKRYDLSVYNYACHLGCQDCVRPCIHPHIHPIKAIFEGRAACKIKELAKTDNTINVPYTIKYFTEHNIPFKRPLEEALKDTLDHLTRINQLKTQLGEFPYTKPILEFCATFIASQSLTVEQVATQYTITHKDIIASLPRRPDTETLDTCIIACMSKGITPQQAMADIIAAEEAAEREERRRQEINDTI
jgi:hypothetical protein